MLADGVDASCDLLQRLWDIVPDRPGTAVSATGEQRSTDFVKTRASATGQSAVTFTRLKGTSMG